MTWKLLNLQTVPCLFFNLVEKNWTFHEKWNFFQRVGNTASLFSSIEVLFEESMAICQRFSKNSAFTKEGEELKDNRKCGCTTSISFTLQFYRERKTTTLFKKHWHRNVFGSWKMHQKAYFRKKKELKIKAILWGVPSLKAFFMGFVSFVLG